MGLIMLILVGTVPMACGLNRSMPVDQTVFSVAVAESEQSALNRNVSAVASLPASQPAAARAVLST